MKPRTLRHRYGHALVDSRIDQWGVQKFSDEHLYFLGKEPQKNGGMSGIHVRVDLLRPRAHPKATKGSVPRVYERLWAKIAEDQVPPSVREAAASWRAR